MQVTRRDFLKYAGLTGGILLSKKGATWGKSLLEPSNNPELITEDVQIPTTCWIGKQECGMLARRVNGRIVKFEGHPDHPRNLGRLCPKGMGQIISIYDPYRIKAPLKRTNPKGEAGKWVEISWDEALTTVGNKIKEVRARDKRLLVWQKGRSKAKAFYDKAFVNASGATKLHHGAFCSDAGYRAAEYTLGLHGVLHPDFRHCRYLLNWGWNLVNAGGNKLCWITWPRQFLDAREKGMKVATLDPSRMGVGPHTDEWLPIRPGKDLAFFLALANVLIEKGYVDEEYLKKHTNAPFLVGEDGIILHEEIEAEAPEIEVGGEAGAEELRKNEEAKITEGSSLVWDLATKSTAPFDKATQPSLEGGYTVNGKKVKTTFQAFKEHVAKYTPEWAEKVCGLSASRIRRVATELGENASIGSTIVLDGVVLPYRPVAAMAYHVSQQELGFQAVRASIIVFMLLGAIEAVGGLRVDFSRKTHGNYKKLNEIEIKDPPYNIYLKDSKFFPINSNNSSLVAHVMLDPEKYGVDYTPEVLIIHMANPAIAFVQQDVIWKSYEKYKFIAVIDPWMSETADYFADIVLPACTIEKYEGPLGVTDQYNDATTLRIPPIPPLFQSRGDINIYIDLCEKAGILYGEGSYIAEINKNLKLDETYKLDLNIKPEVRDIFDRWAKSKGFEEGIRYFEKKGVKVDPIPADKLYAPAWDPPYGGIRHRLYGDKLMHLQHEMRGKGVEKIYWQDYTPFPTWRTPTMDQSPSEYDLYLVSRKKIEFKQSRATFVPLLNELEPEQLLEINPKAARARGIKDGDKVWVESHNAVTGETRKVKVKVQYIEGIRPDTVSLSHHYGFWVHPLTKGVGPTPNSLFFTGEGYVTNTADQSFHVKVRVYK